MALTTYTEYSFQSKTKSVAVILDLASACDTVWKISLLIKLLKKMLLIRSFKVTLNGKLNQNINIQNGFSQDSVLFFLTYLYTADHIENKSKEFINANDKEVVTYSHLFKLTF